MNHVEMNIQTRFYEKFQFMSQHIFYFMYVIMYIIFLIYLLFIDVVQDQYQDRVFNLIGVIDLLSSTPVFNVDNKFKPIPLSLHLD